MELTAAQAFMKEHGVAAWLVHDFRGNNPVLARLLPSPASGKRWTTRRAALLVPAEGAARLLSSRIDAGQFAGLGAGVELDAYVSWREYQAWLRDRLGPLSGGRVAMEYSPGAAMPVVGIVDAGTVELVRTLGVEVVSSADLVQATVAVWSEAALRNHAVASEKVTRVKDEAFAMIRDAVRAGRTITERQVQARMLERFAEEGLETPDGPIVAANAHAGDPHFEVAHAPGASSPIRRGDWVLIDLWARVPGDENIFSDITWVGVVAEHPTARQREVFETVKRARDTAMALTAASWKTGARAQGWRLDRAAQDVLIGAGFERAIRHRTGHSLSPGPMVHGMGVNLDDLETHDTRELLPGLGFTIEPGLYLPEEGLGVRLEINAFVDPARGPVVTSCVQDDVLRLV